MAEESQLNILIKVRDEATAAMRGIANSIEDARSSFSGLADVAGKATGVLAGLGVAGLAIAVNEATKTEVSLLKVQRILQGTGVDIEKVKTIAQELAATTNFGFGEIAENLAGNVRQFGSLEKATTQTKLAMDIAAFTGRDLQIVMKLMQEATRGNIEPLQNLLNQYGIHTGSVDGIANKTEQAAALFRIAQERLGGFAEEVAKVSTFETLKNKLGNIAETVGLILKPAINDFVNNTLAPFLDRVNNFIERNPELTKTLLVVGAAIVGLIAILGSLSVIVAVVTAAFTFIASPIGIIVVAIAAVIAIIVLLITHWDQVKQKLQEVGDKIYNYFMPILRGLSPVFAALIDIGVLLYRNWDTIKTKAIEIWTSIVTFITEKIDAIKDKITGFVDSIKNIKNTVSNAFSSAAGKVGDLVKAAIPFADGGVVTRPTLGLVGEAGPEAIIPLSRLGGGGGSGTTINVSLAGDFMTDDESAEKWANKIADIIQLQLKFNA